ncbi:carbohydrate ABC transporter permease [Actinomadura graeca]|uniref:Carbohydrate ABC transporter permease n=1 Tax=Actinomadura graeca TaxID=2750812 RepID=A0ABX8R294_9ACTN|nr:carbohydrate ABC transporter permease [Actinomadura graeca]QXJ23817.1 carbohydrate ABC transporter permease [Actinomadura graeca]
MLVKHETGAIRTAVPAARARRRRRTARSAQSVVLSVVAFLFAFPILWMFTSAFKGTKAVVEDAFPLTWKSFVPAHPTMANLARLFTDLHFGRDFVNTLIVSVAQVALTLVVATLAGYAFGRLRFRGRDVLFAATLLGAFVPVEAMVIPMYGVAKHLGLLSTYPGIFLPFAFSPFAIYLMRQSFRSLPDETFEAAKLDGAGILRTFWHVGLPGVIPALASLVLIQFINSWSNFFWPLIAMQDPAKQVAQVTMAGYADNANTPLYGEIFAASTLLTVPLVFLALGLQRYYVAGMASSGLK